MSVPKVWIHGAIARWPVHMTAATRFHALRPRPCGGWPIRGVLEATETAAHNPGDRTRPGKKVRADG